MATIHYCEQCTPEWDALRLGTITATCTARVVGKGSGHDNLLKDKAREILTGIKTPHTVTDAMLQGIAREPYALYRYKALHPELEVYTVGFVSLTDYIGVSPDALVGDDGLWECKSPLVTTHKKYLDDSKKLVATYKWQVQDQLYVTGRNWCDLFSYNPECKDDHVCVRVYRDEDAITRIRLATDQFVKELIEITVM